MPMLDIVIDVLRLRGSFWQASSNFAKLSLFYLIVELGECSAVSANYAIIHLYFLKRFNMFVAKSTESRKWNNNQFVRIDEIQWPYNDRSNKWKSACTGIDLKNYTINGKPNHDVALGHKSCTILRNYLFEPNEKWLCAANELQHKLRITMRGRNKWSCAPHLHFGTCTVDWGSLEPRFFWLSS